MDEGNDDIKLRYYRHTMHEIRNALNIMMASCTMAKKSVDNKEKLLDYLMRIYEAGNHLTDIVNEDLDRRSMEKKESNACMDSFSIDDIEEEIKMLIEPIAAEKNLSFQVSSDRFINREIIGDYGLLLRILVNLTTNSIKYSKTGGNISLTFEERESCDEDLVNCIFVCKDDGIGMSESFIEHIFEPYTRADDKRICDIKGSGLGMSIIKEAVETLKGDIYIDSALDAGTTVTIYLKLKKNMSKE